MLPTIEEIKSKYPDIMTADHNQELVDIHIANGVDIHNTTVSVFDPYPDCNYCIGGALQMALGEIESHDDDARNGIFPSSDDLGDTLHWFLNIPYKDESPDVATTNPCPFPDHKDKDCLIQFRNDVNEGALELADKITRANDRGDFDLAWSYVEFVLKLGRKNLEGSK